MALGDRIRARRERRQETDGRRTLFAIAAEVYEDGDTEADLRSKMTQVLEETGESRPFLMFLMKLMEMLLPLLLKGLAGG